MTSTVARLRERCALGRSMRIAAVVGTALTAINQGDVLMHGPRDAALVWRMALNFLVPFLVATYSAFRTGAHMRWSGHEGSRTAPRLATPQAEPGSAKPGATARERVASGRHERSAGNTRHLQDEEER